MNAVKKCSLSGIAFTMDQEAYNELNEYIESLKRSYEGSADGPEIIEDIEARIAELILSTQSSDRVVERPLIRNIIAQMGSATEITEEEPAKPHSAAVRNPRRLYRDTENAKLGGVCAGIGKYFELDPVWIRLAIFLPLVISCFGWIPFFGWVEPLMGNLFGIFVICYLVMWFAVPVARTARQKLEMNGERITADSIRDTTLAAGDPDGAAKTVVADTVSVFGKIVLLLLKLFAGLIVFALVLLACGLFVGAISLAIAGHEAISDSIPLSIPFLGIGIALIPTVMLIYVLVCLLASRKPNGKGVLGLFLLWIVTIIACCVIAIRTHYRDGFDDRAIRNSVERVFKSPNEVLAKSVELDDRQITVGEMLDLLESGEIVKQVEIDLNPDAAAGTEGNSDVHVSISVKKRVSQPAGSGSAAPAETASAADASAEAPGSASGTAANAAAGATTKTPAWNTSEASPTVLPVSGSNR